MLAIIYFGVIIGLIVLFFISLSMFIKRKSVNAQMKNKMRLANGEKLDQIIEQNERIISLLERES